MVKYFILAKVLYSFQWTWTLCCLTDINLAVSVWMISVSFPPRGTVRKSEQWHQFPNRLNTTACLTYKESTFQPDRCQSAYLPEFSIHFVFIFKWTPVKALICMQTVYEITYEKDSLLPASLGFMEAGPSCIYGRNQTGLNNFILTLYPFRLFKSGGWKLAIPFFRATLLYSAKGRNWELSNIWEPKALL